MSLDNVLASVQPTVLRDQVASAIRAAIASGALTSGTRLLEGEFASRMGVSKAPVREALRLLEAEGLVTTIPHRGSFVTEVTPSDATDLFGLRSAIERLAVGLLIDNRDRSILGQMRSSVESMHAAELRADAEGETEADLCFHRLIVSGSGSRRVVKVWSDMQGLIRILVGVGDIQGNRLGGGAARHGAILDAIERGDRQGAQTLLEQHILNAGRYYGKSPE